MIGIVERLRFDAVRCELQFSKGVAGNISDGVVEIERLRAALKIIADWRTINIAGEYEHGLRDIIRSMSDAAAAALEAR